VYLGAHVTSVTISVVRPEILRLAMITTARVRLYSHSLIAMMTSLRLMPCTSLSTTRVEFGGLYASPNAHPANTIGASNNSFFKVSSFG